MFNDEKNKLVVEYIASYSGRSLSFILYKNKKAVDSFLYHIVDRDDFSSLKQMYSAFAADNKMKQYTAVDLVITSFDLSSMNLKVKKSLFSSSTKIEKNFLADNLGSDYEKRFFIKKNKSSSLFGHSFTSFFICPIERIIQAEKVLENLGIKKYRISFMEQHLKEFLKKKKVSDAYLVFEADEYSCLLPIKDGQPINNVFKFRDDASKKAFTQLTNYKNMIASLNHRYLLEENPLGSKIILFGPTDKTVKYKDLSDDLSYSSDVTREALFAKPVGREFASKYSPEAEKKKKSSFDWKKFLGIKKGFTLVETIVAFAIFGIVAAMTATFLSVSISANETTKRTSMATSYIKSINELFHENPTEGTIREITKRQEGESLSGVYYLNESMSIDDPSLTSKDMTFLVAFKYEVKQGDEYIKYTFNIDSLEDIKTAKSYIKPVTLTAVKQK